jgi:hypothetical protein
MSKKRPRPRNAGKKPQELAPYDFIQHCTKVLKARLAAGLYRDNPGLETAVMDFDPAIALIEIAADPANTAETRTGVSVKLMPYWHKEQSLLVKEAGGQSAPTPIVIQIANWALPARAQITAPVVEAEAVDAEAIAHQTNSGPSAPDLSDEGRIRAAARASAVTQILEVPVPPDRPRRVVAEVSQVRGLDMKEELRRKFGGVSFERAATPDANCDIDSKIFGR